MNLYELITTLILNPPKRIYVGDEELKIILKDKNISKELDCTEIKIDWTKDGAQLMGIPIYKVESKNHFFLCYEDENIHTEYKKLKEKCINYTGALNVIKKLGCMQSSHEEEFFCKHDGSKHSIYCPAGIASKVLKGETINNIIEQLNYKKEKLIGSRAHVIIYDDLTKENKDE